MLGFFNDIFPAGEDWKPSPSGFEQAGGLRALCFFVKH